MKGGKITYYLSLLAVAAIAILLVFEINGLFEMFDVMGSRFLVYRVYYSSPGISR